MKISHLSVPFGGPHEDASNDETSLLNSSQIFSFPGPTSSPVTHMTWFKVEVLPRSYNIPAKLVLGSGTQVCPPHQLPHSWWVLCSVIASGSPTTHWLIPTPWCRFWKCYCWATTPSICHRTSQELTLHLESWDMRNPTRWLRKHTINYQLPISLLQTTCSKSLLKSNFFRILPACSHRNHI